VTRHPALRLALLLFAIGALFYREAVMDDTFIHLQYARNLAERGELAFNPGEPSLGMTSPVWILLLALFGGHLMAAKLLSVAAGAVSVWVFWRLAQRLFGGGAYSVAATAAWGGSLWLVRHAPNGMEGTLSVCLVLLMLELRSRGGRSTLRDVWFGVLMGAAALTRPELLILALVYFVVDVRHAWGRSRLVCWLPTMLLLGGLWIGFSLWKTGLWLPATGSAKSAGFDWSPASWWRVLWREARIVGAGHAVDLVGLVGGSVLALRFAAVRSWRTHWLVPYTVFSALLPLAFVLSDLQVQPRYLLPIFPWFVLLGFLAWRTVAGNRQAVAVVVCVASLVWSAAVSVWRVQPSTIAFSRGLVAALQPLIDTIEERGGARMVACPDIGFIGYRGRYRVADLGGLIDPRFQEWTKEFGYERMLTEGIFLEVGPVDYLIDRSTSPQRFADLVTRGRRWTPRYTTMLDNLGLSRPGPFYYTLYSLDPVSTR
jgi:hypothetical protein